MNTVLRMMLGASTLSMGASASLTQAEYDNICGKAVPAEFSTAAYDTRFEDRASIWDGSTIDLKGSTFADLPDCMFQAPFNNVRILDLARSFVRNLQPTLLTDEEKFPNLFTIDVRNTSSFENNGFPVEIIENENSQFGRMQLNFGGFDFKDTPRRICDSSVAGAIGMTWDSDTGECILLSDVMDGWKAALQKVDDLNAQLKKCKKNKNKCKNKNNKRFIPNSLKNLKDAVEAYCTGRNPSVYNKEDLNDWDISQIKTLKGLFAERASCMKSLNGLGAWDVAKVTDFSMMFQGAKNSILNDVWIGSWDVSNAKKMQGMFRGIPWFKGSGQRKWNPTKCNNFENMFNDSPQFSVSLTTWNVKDGAKTKNMFDEKYELKKPDGV